MMGRTACGDIRVFQNRSFFLSEKGEVLGNYLFSGSSE